MIRHVLFDADGVLQRFAGASWRDAMSRHLGDRVEEFMVSMREMEPISLTGLEEFPDVLSRALAQHGIDIDQEAFYVDVWLAIEAVPETITLAGSLRESGLGVHLVTNQHARRAAHMKERLGYADLFGSCFYSCDLGVAKPDPAFFARVSEHLGDAPGELLLVDDSRANIAGARDAGLVAEYWHHDEGLGPLRERLAAHGVVIGGG